MYLTRLLDCITGLRHCGDFRIPHASVTDRHVFPDTWDKTRLSAHKDISALRLRKKYTYKVTNILWVCSQKTAQL